MKNLLILTLIYLFIVSCNGRKYRDEEYKQKQLDYEKKKAELYKAKGDFYLKNKQKLMDFVELLKTLEDTKKTQNPISKDTNYFMGNVVLNSLNLDLHVTDNNETSNKTAAGVFFLHRIRQDSVVEFFENPFKELEVCYKSNNDIPCIKMKEQELQKILDLKYVFLVDDIIKVYPVMKGSSEFESGLYLGRIVFYDILNKKQLYVFAVTAQNSREVSSFQGGLEVAIKEDFKMNLRNSLEEACKKHFLFSRYERKEL